MRDYDDNDRCTACGEHLADPHAIECPHNDVEPPSPRRLRAGDTVRLCAVDDTAGTTRLNVDVTARGIDRLGCGCLRVTALRPGPQADPPQLVQALTGCAAHPAEVESPHRARRVDMAVAKYAADTIQEEPPRYVEPTDANLSAAFAGCVRPPSVELYDDIRAAFARQYGAEIAAARGGAR